MFYDEHRAPLTVSFHVLRLSLPLNCLSLHSSGLAMEREGLFRGNERRAHRRCLLMRLRVQCVGPLQQLAIAIGRLEAEAVAVSMASSETSETSEQRRGQTIKCGLWRFIAAPKTDTRRGHYLDSAIFHEDVLTRLGTSRAGCCGALMN